MKYFTMGLNKEQLTVEYRKLAKKYHPDISKEPNAAEIMKEINAEYDEYFVSLQKESIGFDWDDLMRQYKNAERSRTAILMFLRYDKKEGGGWFTTRRDLWGDPEKLKSNDDASWDRFHGGFKLVEEGNYDGENNCIRLIPVSARIECPSIQDMYFAMKGQRGNANAGEVQAPNAPTVQEAYASSFGTYQHIRTKRNGEMWTAWPYEQTVFMKVNGLVTSARIPKYVLEDAEVLDRISAIDLGFIQYQGLTFEEFARTHDVNYAPLYSDVVGCRKIKADALYWLDDPVVAYFARKGVIRFYEAGTNFRMRYGTFDKAKLEMFIHELSVDDAEHIQDFLDDLNEQFEEYIKSLIKRGKIRIIV